MSVNILELVTNTPGFDVANILENDNADFKPKLYNSLISLLGTHSTKTNALKKLNSILEKENQDALLEIAPKLFTVVTKIVSKSSETLGNKRIAAQCLINILEISLDGGEFQKEVGTAMPSLITSLLNLDCTRTWVPLLAQIMRLFPGPCGPLRGQIWTKLSGLVGTGRIQRSELGRIFSLFPSLGGGGKEGIEHARAYIQTYQTVHNTANNIINNVFTYLKEFDSGLVGRDLMTLDGPVGFTPQATMIQQFIDLVEIQCSMMTMPFPQVREIRCDEVLGDVTRLLSVSDALLAQTDIPEHQVLRLLLPSLHAQALQLLQCLILSVGEDILPDIATINNIFLKTFNTSKSLKVREALYATLSVYVETLGACTGLEHCLERIIPFVAGDVTPHQDKLLLVAARRRHGGPKRKKSKQADAAPPVNKVNLNINLCRAGLNLIEILLENLGCLMSGECYRDLSCTLINLALKNQITDPQALISVYKCLGGLSTALNPGFKTPLRLCIQILQSATLHQNGEVSRTAKLVLSSLTPLVHPQCPSLEISVMDETEMRRIVAKVLIDQEEKEERHQEKEQETKLNSAESTGFFGSKPSFKPNADKKLELKPIASKVPTLSTETETTTTSPVTRQVETPKSISLIQNAVTKSAKKVEKIPSKPDEDKPLKRKHEEESDVLENVDKLSNNLQEIVEKKKVRQESTSKEEDTKEPELDVATMLKDFSDKLNENLVPDPWEDDEDQ